MITEILNYTIIRKIGEGSMGQVFLAKNKSIEQFVAIKMLNPRFSNNPALRDRFRQEAIMLSSLSHPNIVQFLNYVENEHGVFLIMEYVEGMTLEDYITKKTGLLVEEKAFPLIFQILDAFAYAHDRNMVHRDIKPSNIFVTNDGNIKILDFGIAQILSESGNNSNVYSGTIEYMSPEQVQNKPLDISSDIYSLGVVFHQMLTGRAPYDPETMTVLDIKKDIVGKPLERMNKFYPYISADTQWFVDRATCKTPAGRFPDCHDMIQELKRISGNAQVEGGGGEPKKSSKVWIIAAVCTAIIIAGGILGYIYFVNNTIQTFDDYSDVWGLAEGIGKADKSAGSNHYQITLANGKPTRVTYVNASGQTADLPDSLLSIYKHVDMEFVYGTNGNLKYKNIYDKNGKITHKVVYGNDMSEATVERPDDSSGTSYRLIYNPQSGRLNTLYYLDSKGAKKAVNGVYGEQYKYDSQGRLTRVTYIDEKDAPSQADNGVGVISFEYNNSLAGVKSNTLNKAGKPVVPSVVSADHQDKEKAKGKKQKPSKKNKDDSQPVPPAQENPQHQYLRDNMKNRFR